MHNSYVKSPVSALGLLVLVCQTILFAQQPEPCGWQSTCVNEGWVQETSTETNPTPMPAPSNTKKTTITQEYGLVTNVSYHEQAKQTEYMKQRCQLDLYHPKSKRGYATVVWFHGGGLRSGEREVPKALRGQGIAVVAVNYRLFPKAKSPAYIQDAAAAVAWTFRNIERYGGSTSRIFVSGHSAGGYLTSMVGLDRRWLAAHQIEANKLAGLIPFSGHSITHFTVREERGIDKTQPIVDDLAPLFHVRKDAPPILLITGDRDLELFGRYEETAYFWRMMQTVGHSKTDLHELDGYNHGNMPEGAFPLLLRFVRDNTKER